MRILMVIGLLVGVTGCQQPHERYIRQSSATLDFNQAYGQCEAQGYAAGASERDAIVSGFTRGRVRDACMRGHGYQPRY